MNELVIKDGKMELSGAVSGLGDAPLGMEDFDAAAEKARRERHLSAVLNAQLYGRGNKEVDALVDEFTDAKALTGDDEGYWTSQEDKDMRLGGKVARDFNDGDVWGTLKGLEDKLPEDEREAWRMELRACDTETKGKVLLGKTLRGMAEKRWAQMEEERKEAEGLPDAVKNELADYVISGKFSPELMGQIDKFKAMDALAPSLGRARAAYEWMLEMQHGGEKGEYEARVKQEADRLEEEWKNGVHARWDADRTRDDFIQQAKANVGESYEITRNDILQLVELLKDEDGKLDEGALAGVVLALNRDAEGQQSIDSRFIRNFLEGGKRWFMSTADWMNRNNARNGFIWTGPDTAPIYLTKEQQEEFQAEYSPDVEKALDGLRQLEDARLSAADKSIWYSKVASGLGTIAGQNIPFFASAALGGNIGMLAGTAAMFPDIANREIGSAYARGEKHPELVGNITGLMQAGAEGMFGRLAGGNKLVGRLLDKGAAGLVSVPVLGKALGAIQGRSLLRFTFGVASESAGELFVEDATAETLSYLTLGGLRKLGVDIKEQEFAPLGHVWKNFKDDPYQAAATVAYCGIMGMFGAGGTMRAARDFAQRTEVTQAAGLKAASARRLAQMAQSATVTEAEFKKEAMRLYEEEVINEDPVELKKRLEAQGQKFLEQAEVLMYARSGVRDYILQESGILNPEQNGDGTYHVVRQVKDAEGKEQTVESDWTEEQLNAYVSMRRGSMMEDAMRELQARMQGLAMAQAEMSEEDKAKGEIIALQNVPTAALAEMKKNGGRITYNVMKALAAEAAEKVEGYVAEGMSREEAEGQESAVRGVSLRSLMGAAEGFRQRVDAMQGTAEGKALGITPETASTAVFRLGGMSAGQSVLLYNRGHVNEREIVEDLIERDLGAEVTEAGQMQELGRLLKRVEEGLMKIDKGMRLLPEGKESYTRQDIVEAFSTLAQSHFLLNHGRYNMPQEAHDSIEYVQKKLADAQHLVAISRAWDAFAKSKEGREFIKREGATLEKLMEESGASVAGHYAAAKLDATVFEAVREAYEEGSSITRAAEVLEEYAKEQNELDNPPAPEEAEGISKEDSPTGEEITPEAQEDLRFTIYDLRFGNSAASPQDGETNEAPRDEERGKGLVNGMYAEAGDGSVYGVARVEDLSISADVPQFKKKEVAGQREAANEDGTTHELSGGWNAKSAPIIVWRRRDGRLEVISGRHRLAHAKKNGVQHIAVRVYDEDAVHDAAWAKLYDVEVNILEGTCGAIDVAFYFRHNPMSIAEAEARGLMPKTQAGGQTAASRMGIMIATRASGYVFDSLVNGGVSAEDAYMACVITESAEGQELALKARKGTKGKKRSWEYVTALVRGAEQMAPEGGGGLMDLFGFDEGFANRAKKMADYVEAVRRQLRRRIDVLRVAGSLQRKGEMTREMGVKIDRPEDAVRIIERLAKLDAAYEAMDPELGIAEAAESWDGKSEPDLRFTIDDLRFGSEAAAPQGEGSFSVDEAKERGLFKDGVMEAANGVIVEPGADFSAAIRGLQHATPHLFRRFMLDYARKGEGNLAYGFGVYLSESWEVNHWYWDKFKRFNYLVDLDVEERELLYWDETPAAQLGDAGNPGETQQLYGREVLGRILGVNMDEPTGQDVARLVRRIHDGLMNSVFDEAYSAFSGEYDVDAIEDAAANDELDVGDYDMDALEYWAGYVVNGCMTGGEIYNELAGMLAMAGVNDKDMKEASKFLLEHGIKAIRYKDGASRREGEDEPTFNYVVFDPDLIRITHVNQANEWSEYSEGNGDWERVEDIAWEQDGDVSFSVTKAKERGLFKDGVMEVANGVLIDRRGDDFSAAIENAQSASPNLYREPDLDYVGAGEGNQAQGWGLYWSTRWSTNRFYHNKFSTAGDPIKPGSKEERLIRLLAPALYVKKLDMEELDYLASDLEDDPSTPDRLTNVLKDKGFNEEDLAFFHEAIANMTIDIARRGLLIFGALAPVADIKTRIDGEDISFRFNPDGGEFAVNYLADLDVDDSNVLYWDEPASRLFDEHPGLLEAYRDKGGEYTGKEKGQDIYRSLDRLLGSDKAASQWLDARGIRGNKYLDGMSRGKKDGEKMYNYVIFNEDYVKITRINNRHKWSEYSEDNPEWQRPEDVDFSASVIGERARTWGRYKDRAFAGRDDGRMRAEIDASKAKLKKGGMAKYRAAAYEEKDFCKLGDLLSYPELYAAYPWMREVPVDKQPKGRRGSVAVLTPLDKDKTGRIRLGEKETEEETRRSLLHEVQHLIQRVEHFASGASSGGMVREVMRELGREGELPDTNDEWVWDAEKKEFVYNPFSELYYRAAGEIEARNVAARAGMSARERLERAFNETLDRPASEAIAFDSQEYLYSYRWNALRYWATNEKSGASPDVSMSVRNLAAVHTLSVENFLKQAKEWGGMPLPSVAVTRLDRPYDWDVDHEPMVMLVGRPDMVDPEGGAEVYARDAWMGRMPEVEEERGEDGKVRRFFYDEKGEKVDATLENMTGYLMRRKQKGNSAHETPDAARSLMARRLRSMEDVKGRRRMLQAEPENRVTDVEIYRWMDMATEHDWGWSAKKARTLFRVLADVDEVTKWNVLAAIEGSEEEDLMELQNGLDEDSDFIRETVRVMKEMRKERRNYVEATPRRVVGMDEWVYAVFSEKIPDKDEVRRVCRENGIIPIEYKAGERDKALGQLIDDGDVSFSVRGASLLDRVNLREMAEEEKMSRLMTRARRGAARWRRVFMDDKTSAADAARALGEVSSVMEAVYAYLPAGERPSYARKMKLVEAYARLVETGRVWHRENAKSEGARAKQEVLDEVMAELEKVSTVKGEALREVREGYVREVAGRKLSEVAVSMVEDAVDAVERHLVRREMDVVKRMAEALKPKKLKSGKMAPGKMSAEGYRRFAKYMKMVEMSAEEKAERMEELAAKLDKESEAEKQEPIEEEMRELATFGALGSGKLADVRRGVAELIGFVRGERTSWEGRVELEKEQMKHFARVAVEAMGGVDRNKLAARRDRAKKPLRTILGTQKGFMSLGQMWMAMQGVPALRGLAEWSLERLARGNVALGMRERALREAEVAFMAQELGLTSEAARNNFIVDLKKERATGVRKAGEKRVHKVRVSVDEAREIVAMSKEERKARNERIRKEADEKGVDAKNIVEDEDVELMAEELKDVGRKKYITTEREYRTEESDELVLSKDNALNLILLAEQADYAESADAQGYTPGVIEALREFVGKEALAYGYWMRERLGNNGLAEVWEAREGIPFPAVEDYWPGRFDQSSRINERSALDGMSGGNGTRYGMLITRVRHNLNFDESLGATNVFRAALAQQNSYIVMGELTARWRKLLAQRDFAPAVEGAMGQERFETFKEFLNLLDGLGARETAIEEAHSRMLGLVQSARAMTVLSLAPATLVKQLSAVLNGTVSGVSGARLLTQMVQDMTSKQPISWREVAELDCIKVRYENTEEYQKLQRMGRNATWSRAARVARMGMELIGKVDVLTNILSMTALYNVTYKRLMRAQEGAADALSEAEVRERCERVVEQALETAAQPLRDTQKAANIVFGGGVMKVLGYMGNETFLKVGATQAVYGREGGGARGFWKAFRFMAGFSTAMQLTAMLCELMRGTAPDGDDDAEKWAGWLLTNALTALSGAGLMQSVPIVGEVVSKATGGYVRSGTYGEMVFDYGGAWNAALRLTGIKEKKNETWLDQANDVMQVLRFAGSMSGLAGGVNATTRGVSEACGVVQSLNAMSNPARVMIQYGRNDAKREKKRKRELKKRVRKVSKKKE